MGMLERIKKKHLEGFKDFVLNMETTGQLKRQQILIAGILEDPVFMTYVMKNVRNFNDFLTLPSEEVEKVLLEQEQLLGVLAKSLFGMTEEKIGEFTQSVPKFASKIHDELSYLKDVSTSEIDGARYYIIKIVRKLQMQELINGFRWQLPPQDLFQQKTPKDGPSKIYFESGILAAEGEVIKGKRTNFWKHYYDSGKLMAEGEYLTGLKHNAWVFYYGNGDIKAQGKYRSDLKQGLWKEWDRNGVLFQSEYYEGVKKE